MTGYKIENSVGSPRLHLLNQLREAGAYSEFYKDGYIKVFDESGYYFSQELVEKDFEFNKCVTGKRSLDFLTVTGYSRPKINAYIERHGRITYLTKGYYNLDLLREFIIVNMKELSRRLESRIETRGRHRKIKN